MGKINKFCRIMALALCFALALGLTSGMILRDAEEEPASEVLTPTDTAEPVETEGPPETAEPMETMEPTETAEPTETMGPTETAEPTETVEPTETAGPTETAEPTDAPAEQSFTCETTDGVTVSAVAAAESGIPADAILHADPVAEGTEAYTRAYDALWTRLGLAEGDELYFVPYDVYFTAAGGEGEVRLEPQSGLVTVTMRFPADPFADIPAADSDTVSEPADIDGSGIEDPGAAAPEMVTERFVVHILDDGSVERLASEPVTGEDGTVTFAVGSFSTMGPALVRRSAEPAGNAGEIYVPAAPEGVEGIVTAATIEAAAERLPPEGGAIWLTGDVEMDTAAFAGKTVTVKSYDETIYNVSKSLDGTGENMFVLENGASLTLENVTVDATANTLGRTVTASGGSTLTLSTGASLVNNKTFGAVYLDGSTIKIEGGVISGNSTTKDEGTLAQVTYGTAFRFAYNSANAGRQGLGGAVLMAGSSTFTMTAGEISGNSAICGGGVYAYDSAVTINGGTFSGNVADTATADQAYGGAIHVDGAASTALQIGGSAQLTGNSAQRGGAFSTGIDADMVALTITGGSFTDNTAKTYGSIAFISSKNSAIDISGAVFSGNSAAKEGGIYKAANAAKEPNGNGKFTIHGDAQFINNTANKGPCVYVTKDNADAIKEFLVDGVTFRGNTANDYAGVMQYNVPNSTFTIKNSAFENNRSNNNGGCFYAAADAQGTTFTFENSTFTGNYAKNQGGVWRGFPPQSEFVFKSCTFTDNTAETGDGGCFYFPGDGPNSNITIDGGAFTGNRSGSSGGAFRANLNGGSVTVTGGAVFSGNSADVNAGAFSVRRKGEGYKGTVHLLSCTVDGNWCNANFDNYKEADLGPTKHYNTGGIYIGENITCYMQDALITGNHVEGGYTGSTVGNGIGLCPNAQVFLYPEHGAMICDNGDNGGMDILAVPSDPVITHENPAKLYISDTTPDGRAYNWTDLNDEKARTGEYDWTNEFSGIATMSAANGGSGPVGFKAHVGDSEIMTMAANGDSGYPVVIRNNYSLSALYGGGGVMVNGKVIAGYLNFEVTKTVTVNGATTETTNKLQNDQEYKFRLNIVDSNDSEGTKLKDTLSAQYHTEKDSASKTLTFTKTPVDSDGSYSGYKALVSGEFSVTGQDKVIFDQISKNSVWNDDGTDYYFFLEETDSGGASSVSITGSQSTSGDLTTFSFTATNTFNFGELDLTKTVEKGTDSDKNKLWTFKVHVDGLNGEYPVDLGDPEFNDTQGDLTFAGGKAKLKFTNGDATVQLKDGQTLKIQDIPVGESSLSYTVTEDPVGDNYESTSTGNTGTLTSERAAEVTFTNTRKTGKLTVSKTVAGPRGDTNKDWTFNIVLTDSDGSFLPENDYEYTINGPDTSSSTGTVHVDDKGNVKINGSTDGDGSINLKHNQSITITGLPAGAAYEVTEEEANQPPYKTDKTGDTGEIKAEGTAEAKFTNTAQVGSLTVGKTVADGGDQTLPFKFTITLDAAGTDYADNGKDALNGIYSYTETGGVTHQSDDSLDTAQTKITFTNGQATVYLTHDQSITITGLPAGVKYTVTEEAEHYTATWDGSTGGTNTGTITTAGSEVKCTNTIISATLPDTGGPGTARLALLSAMLCLAGGAIILCARGRRGKARCAHTNHICK